MDHHITVKSQEYRLYELPWMEGWSLIVNAVASCSNGPSGNIYFVLGDDRAALREGMFGKGRKRGNQEAEA